MNSRERIFRLFKKKKLVDKIPWSLNFGATAGLQDEIVSDYKKSMNIETTMAEYLDFDINLVLDPEVNDDTFYRKFTGIPCGTLVWKDNGIKMEDYYDMKKLPKNGHLDAYGIYHAMWPGLGICGEMIPPLANADLKTIKTYPLPDLEAEAIEDGRKDVEKIKSRQKTSVCYAEMMYEMSRYLRGGSFYTDVIDNPGIIHALMEKTSIWSKKLATVLQNIGVDMLSFYDDFGTEEALQISPKHWREFVKPYIKDVWSTVKKNNPDTIIFLHSCGFIEEILDDLIELGVDAIHTSFLKSDKYVSRISERYPDEFVIYGTIDAQNTIPFGTPEDVDKEVKKRVEMLRNRPFFCAPSAPLGPEVPFENITAFWKACKKYC